MIWKKGHSFLYIDSTFYFIFLVCFFFKGCWTAETSALSTFQSASIWKGSAGREIVRWTTKNASSDCYFGKWKKGKSCLLIQFLCLCCKQFIPYKQAVKPCHVHLILYYTFYYLWNSHYLFFIDSYFFCRKLSLCLKVLNLLCILFNSHIFFWYYFNDTHRDKN